MELDAADLWVHTVCVLYIKNIILPVAMAPQRLTTYSQYRSHPKMDGCTDEKEDEWSEGQKAG